MNEDPQICNQLPYVKIWGFDILNIKDFINAFMQFGVSEVNYLKFYRKIQKQNKLLGEYTSLSYISDSIFLEFCRHFFDFWKLITQNLPNFVELPQFIFCYKNSYELASRNYELHLIRKHCQATQNSIS
jgi:hypothetical protein